MSFFEDIYRVSRKDCGQTAEKSYLARRRIKYA